MRFLTLILIFFIFNIKINSQNFRPPVDIPMYLSGTFGELRSNHFHSGIDIKTQGVEGIKVYAAEKGYVSRIKISPWGYGKALYITHPNGFTTVYAHLKNFNTKIDKYVKEAQYKNERFDIELFPEASVLPVSKGELIAYSGNTGSSAGPHLHFEIRETKSEKPVNPLLFDFPVKDNIPPVIKKIKIYPLDEFSFVDGGNYPKQYKVISTVKGYRLAKTPVLFGKTGFAIMCFDKMNGVNNKNGIVELSMWLDNKKIYNHRIDKFSFDETRYINALIDYETYKRENKIFQRTYLLPNNQLNIYKNIINRGIIIFNDDSIHKIKFEVKDAYDNVSVLNFNVKSLNRIENYHNQHLSQQYVAIFKYDKRNTYKTNKIFIDLPAGSLYDNLKFEFFVNNDIKNAITPTYHIHNEYTPLQNYYTISIKVDSLPNYLKNKALIVSADNKGKIYAEGGYWNDSFITCRTRSFGAYAVMLDTVKPVIKPVSINKNSIIINISDNLSGINYYRGTIDGKWILMEYEPKKQELIYTFDNERIKHGKHHFKLIVEDKQKNTSVYETNFEY